MGLLTEKITIRWNGKTKQHFIDKGYEFTKLRESFEINVFDLPHNSHYKVDCKCDRCNKISNMTWQSYNDYTKNTGKYYCCNCAKKLYGGDNLRKALLVKNGVSFKDWCFDNLSTEQFNQIMLRWDIDKNHKSPDQVSYSSGGFNRKGYWFKCLNNPKHESELKDISSFTTGNGTLDCIQCKSIASTNPEYIDFFINVEDAKKYSHASNKKTMLKCPYCGYEKNMCVANLIKEGFGCPCCSDGISYPEKFMRSFFDQINADYVYQLGKSIYDWCDNHIYDFYVKDYNCIIEINGLQHYDRTYETHKYVKRLEEEQDNDILKKCLAYSNGISEYIILDGRYSTINWIKNSIMNSTLSNMYDLSTVDWEKCHKDARSSYVKTACDFWNNGSSISKISDVMKLGYNTIQGYLKRGNNLNLCTYDPSFRKTIRCVSTGEIFSSSADACKKYDLNSSNLSICLHGHTVSCGKHPITQEKLLWEFYKTSNKEVTN